MAAFLLIASPPLRARGLETSLSEDGTLSVMGTESDDRITVRVVGRIAIELLEVGSERETRPVHFPLDRVSRLSVSGRGGNDRIVLLDPSHVLLRSGRPVTLDGGPGNDRIDASGSGAFVPLNGTDQTAVAGLPPTEELQALRQGATALQARVSSELLEPQGAFFAQVDTDLVEPGAELARLGDVMVARSVQDAAEMMQFWLSEPLSAVLDELLPTEGKKKPKREQPESEAATDGARLNRLLDELERGADVAEEPSPELREAAIEEIEQELDRLEASYRRSLQGVSRDREAARRALEHAARSVELASATGDRVGRELEHLGVAFEQRVQQELVVGSERIAARGESFRLAGEKIEREADRVVELALRVGGPIEPDVSAGEEPGAVVLFDEVSFDCSVTTVLTIAGGSGNDELFGSPFGDEILGEDGDDLILGFGGGDLLRGGDGRDDLFGGSGRDEVHGDAGRDNLFGGSAGDCLWGDDGIDVILGDDPLFGSPGADAADGGDGFDVIFGFAESDLLVGGAGPDVIFGMEGDDTIYGDHQDPNLCDGDELDSDAGIDLLFGNRGNDSMYGGDGVELDIPVGPEVTIPLHLGNAMFGNRGDDTMFGGHGMDVMFGNRDDDRVDGCQHIDVLFGNRGNDEVLGGEGGVAVKLSGVPIRLGNVMFGNQGDDEVRGGPDLDVGFGNQGNDQVFGGDGTFLVLGLDTDFLFGNKGNDTLDGGLGRDWVFGNAGDDIVRGDDGTPLLIGYSADWLFGNRGEDLLEGGNAQDILFGNQEDDRLRGGRGIDLLFGNRGCDDLRGDNGLDVLFGNQDDDTLSGGPGPDLLFGNRGQDTLSGDSSFDFLFGDRDSDALEGGLGWDLVVGGDGDDSLRGSVGLNVLIGNEGEDRLFGTGGFLNILSGDRGEDCLEGGDLFDLMLGGRGDDCMAGRRSTDIMDGGFGDDTMFGDQGWDLMFGDFGDDRLVGGPGWDVIGGGPGFDRGWASFFEFPGVELRNPGPEPTPCACVFRDVRPGCIRGVKFHDLDRDGERDPGEPGLGGWTIGAVGEAGTKASDVTADDGSYSICCLPADRYEVSEVLLPGWKPMAPPSGSQTVELAPGQMLGGIDFGNVKRTGVPPGVETGCIEGTKFEDLDGDGQRDPGEPGLGGWSITALSEDRIGSSAVTEQDGTYSICDLPPGRYQVSETLQTDWLPTRPFPGTGSQGVDLEAGEVQTGIDFGNRFCPNRPDPDGPCVRYWDTSPAGCREAPPDCDRGEEVFNDECGCGCIDVADLVMTKDCEASDGRFVGCTLKIRNEGCQAARPPLIVEDRLPEGFRLDPQGTDPACRSATDGSGEIVRCTLDRLPTPEDPISIRLLMQGDPSLGYENCASLREPSDLDPSDNRDCFRGCPEPTDPRVNYSFDNPVDCAAPPAPLECGPGEELFDDECGCGCIQRDVAFSVSPTVDQSQGCDRKGAVNDTITLKIEGGVGPFECKQPDPLQEPTMPNPRTCAFAGVPVGTYTFVVTDDATGEQEEEEVRVEEPVDVSLDVTDATPVGITLDGEVSCIGGSVRVTPIKGTEPFTVRVTGPSGRQFVPPAPLELNEPFTVEHLQDGTYSVALTDDLGCRVTKEFEVGCSGHPPDPDPPIPDRNTTFQFRLHVERSRVDGLGIDAAEAFAFQDFNGNDRFDPGEPVVSGEIQGQESRLTDLELDLLMAQVQWQPRAFGVGGLLLQLSLTGELGEGRSRWERVLPLGGRTLPGHAEEDSGFVWGAGAALDLRACPACRWSVGVWYRLFEAPDLKADGFNLATPFGEQVPISTTAELDLRRDSAEVAVGYTIPTGQATFQLGYRGARYEADLDARSAVGDLVILNWSQHRGTIDEILGRALFRPGEHWSIQGEAGLGSAAWSAGLSIGYEFGGGQPAARRGIPAIED